MKAQTGGAQVDVLAHSRGTTVMHAYLSDPGARRVGAPLRQLRRSHGRRAARRGADAGDLGRGDCRRARSSAPTNVYFPNKAHTEVTTSREAFADVFEFLTGDGPETKNVLPEKPNRVTVAGRALLFPTNTGIEGGLLEVYALDAATGRRKSATPVYTMTIGADGAFGPFEVDGRKHYEFAISRPGLYTLHNYPEPFEHDDHFYRVLDAPPLRQFIERSPRHTTITVTRMREFWGDQADPAYNDSLVLNGLEVMNPQIAPRARRVLAVFNFDKGTDGVSDTSASLSPFNAISFLTGVDNYLPASADASGTIPVEETMRGNRRHAETINVPNWPSDQHTVTVYFKDYAAKEFRARPTRARR